MTGPGLGVVPLISVAGTDLNDAWYDALLEVRVDLEYRLPGRAVLRFDDPGFRLMEQSTMALGKAVTVSSNDGSATVGLLTGTVTGMRVEARKDGTDLEVVVHDAAHALARGTTVASYLTSTPAEVVRKIAERRGLLAKADAAPLKLDYLLQVDSDLQLLDAMADRTGYDWWVENGTLMFRKPGTRGTLKADLGDLLTSFEVRASALRPDVVEFAGWDPATRTTFRGKGQVRKDKALLNGGADGPYSAAATPASVLPGSTSSLLGSDEPVRDLKEAEHRAQAAAARFAAGAVTATAVLSDVSEVRLGWDLTVGSAGRLSGDYHVSRIEHRFGRSGYQVVLTAGDRRPASLVDTLGRGSGGATSPAPALAPALVTQVGNPSNSEEAGRVKVTFQGLAQDGPAGQESHWARVLVPGGGSDRGVLVMPEVDDEVLVGFERGDLRQPVVFGGLVAGTSGELYRMSGSKVGVRGLRSRLGHVIELADGTGPDDQHVLISLQGRKHRFRLGKDRCDLEVPGGVPVKVTVGSTSSMEFDGSGKVTVKATDIVLEARNKLELKGTEIKINGSMKVTVEAGAQGLFKAGATLGLEGGAMTTLKGGLVNIN